MFDSILGHGPVKAYLERAFQENRLPQSLLFIGPDGVGKGLLANAVAEKLLGRRGSPDLYLLGPEGKSGLYAIDSLRDMIEKEHAASYEGRGKVFILQEADRMLASSGNLLLKTLEEPTEDTTFILLTSRPQGILPTIASRCCQLHFHGMPQDHIEQLLKAKGFSPHFAKMAQGSAGYALEWASHPTLAKEQAILFSLLQQSPSYPDLYAKLISLEELMAKEKEEDPVRISRHMDHLFASILMWHRDQHVRHLNGRDLFFPDEPAREPLDLQKVEEAIEQGKMAYLRNMRIFICFLAIFQTIPASS